MQETLGSPIRFIVYRCGQRPTNVLIAVVLNLQRIFWPVLAFPYAISIAVSIWIVRRCAQLIISVIEKNTVSLEDEKVTVPFVSGHYADVQQS